MEVLKIRRLNDASETKGNWAILVKNLLTGESEELFFDAVVLCTGVSRHFERGPAFMDSHELTEVCIVGLPRARSPSRSF